MNNDIPTATPEQLEEAQRLIIIAGLPPETRLELEGILTLRLEPQVNKLITDLKLLIQEKEAAYQDYKKTIQAALDSTKPNS